MGVASARRGEARPGPAGLEVRFPGVGGPGARGCSVPARRGFGLRRRAMASGGRMEDVSARKWGARGGDSPEGPAPGLLGSWAGVLQGLGRVWPWKPPGNWGASHPSPEPPVGAL